MANKLEKKVELKKAGSKNMKDNYQLPVTHSLLNATSNIIFQDSVTATLPVTDYGVSLIHPHRMLWVSASSLITQSCSATGNTFRRDR